jgi:hypothetical protein
VNATPRFPDDDALERMTPEQRELALFMSELSERCYCAGWLDGCEFSLWGFVLNGPGKWGMGEVYVEDVARLKTLSEKCGGWIAWPDNANGETFVAIGDWLRQLAEARP